MKRATRCMLAVALAAVGVGAIAPGCFGRECEGIAVEYGLKPGEGAMVDLDTWESNPIDGTWMNLEHQRRIIMRFGSTRPPISVQAYVSPSERPVDEATRSNFTLAGGNVAKTTYYPGTVELYNDTCADFFTRVVIQTSPSTRPNLDAGADGGIDDAGDSGIRDAGEGGN